MTPKTMIQGVLFAALTSSAFAFGLVVPSLAQPVSAPASETESVYDRLFRQAAQARQLNRPEAAVEALRKILDSQPDNTEALFQLAGIQLAIQDLDRARDTITRLKKIDPTDPRGAELERTLAFGPPDEALLVEARKFVEARQYDRAIAAYRQAFGGERPPYALALEFYETLAGTPNGAAEARQQLKLLADNRSASARTKLAYARVLTYSDDTRRDGIALLAGMTGDGTVGQTAVQAMREAMLWLAAGPQDKAFYEAYLQRFPNDTQVREKLATALLPPKLDPTAQRIAESYKMMDAGAVEAAGQQLEALQKAEPSNADAMAALGIVRLRQERFSEARDLLARATALAPARASEWMEALESSGFWASYHDAIGLRDKKDYAAAEKILRPLAERTVPGQAAAQSVLADVLRRQGRGREAEALYRDALKRKPTDKDAMAGLLESVVAQGRDPSSDPLLASIDVSSREALRTKRTHDAGEQMRASAKAAEKTDSAKAEALYRQAAQIDPSNPWIVYDLANTLTRAGRGAEAQTLIAALATSSNNESLYAAAVYQSEQKRPQEALALLERIPAGQRNGRTAALIGQIAADDDMDRLVAAARAGDAGARATIVARAAAQPNPQQAANAALALAKVGETSQAMATVQRLAVRNDLTADVLRPLFYASLEAGADTEARALLARLGSVAGGGNTAAMKETMVIRQADRLREQKQLPAAFDTLAPYIGGRTASVPLRLALARVYRDSRFVDEAMQVLDGIAATSSAGADTLAEIAGIAIDLGKYDRAATWLTGALQQQPQNARLHLMQAKLLRANGDIAGAQRALETARQLNTVGRQSSRAHAPMLPPSPRRASPSRVASLDARTPGAIALPRRDDSMTIRVAQADSTAPVPVNSVPLRRPGSAATNVAAAGLDTAPKGTPDALGREIEKELVALEQKAKTTIEGAVSYRTRSGDAGQSRLNEVSAPMKAQIPVGNGAISARIMPVTLNAGGMSNDAKSLDRFGSNAAQAIGSGNVSSSQTATGAAIALGFDWSGLSVEAGTSPLGFAVTNFLGAISWQRALSEVANLRVTASRRSVTDSLLSYAGVVDPRTGATWGGVTRTGGESILSFDDGYAGAYGKVGYGSYTGANVANNNGLEVTAGAYIRPVKDANSELKVGIAATYMAFQQNLGGFTVGQGGYFSPQNFFNVGVPVDWTETHGRFKYTIGGTVGVQSIQSDGSAYFPNNSGLQAAAVSNAATDSTRSAYSAGSSVTKLSFGARIGFDYAVNDHVIFGGKAELDNSQDYNQGSVMLFLRSAIN